MMIELSPGEVAIILRSINFRLAMQSVDVGEGVDSLNLIKRLEGILEEEGSSKP